MTNVLKSKFAKASLGVLVGVLALASTASAMTQDAATALVNGLGITGAAATALIAALTTTTAPATPGSCSYTFAKNPNLKVGSKGEAVMQLQKVLNSDADTALAVKAGSTGSTGNESTSFGPATKAAVIKFQTKHSITPASGFVGSITAAALNAACATNPTPTPTPTPVTGPVSVMLSTDNPVAGNVVSAQAAADLAHFTFSGSGTVTGVTLQRTGISANTDIPNVYLYNGVTRVSDSASVNTNGVITFANLNLAVSGATTISVKADIASAANGTVGVTMTSYMVSGSTTANTVSLMGNQMSCVSASSIASVFVGVVSPAVSTTVTVNAGTMNYSLWSAPVTVSTRTVMLKSAAFQVIGSAPTDALQNVTLYVNGTSVAKSTGVNSMGYVSFDLSATPATLQTGPSTLEVRADVVKGSNRTVSLALQNAADLTVMDTQLSVNVAATVLPKAAGTVSINAGSVTVTTDPTFTATTVTNGVTNVPLARYNFKAYGEDVKISNLYVSSSVNLDNVALFSNGAQISGTTANYTGTQIPFSLGSSLIIPAGTTVSVEVRADTKAAGINLLNPTVAITLTGYPSNAQGVTSSNISTVPATSQAGPTLTVGIGSLTLAKTTSFVNQNVVPNTTNQKIGSFTIQAGSSEGTHITSLIVDMSGTANTLPVTSLSNLYIKYGTTSSTPINPQSTTNNFSTNITLAVNASIVVDVYADIGNSVSVTNTNTTPQTLTSTCESTGSFLNSNCTTPAANGVPASATVTFTGTAGGTSGAIAFSLNGVQRDTFMSGTLTAAAAATQLYNDLQSTSMVTGGGYVVTNGSAGVVTITASAAGSAHNFNITATDAAGSGQTVAASPSASANTTNGTDNTAQVNRVTPANVEIGDVFTVGIGSRTVSYTATDTLVATVVTHLASLWTADSGAGGLATLATASDQTTYLRLTAVTAGTAGEFTTVMTAVNGSHSSTGLAVSAILGLTATGTTSNSSVAAAPSGCVVATYECIGQVLTVQTGSLATTASVTSASPVAQYVIGGTTGQMATYNFVATNGSAVIDELDFTTTDSSGAPLASLTVNGVTSLVGASGATVALTNLNLAVPISYGGTDVPVTATWNTVGYGNQPSNNTAYITLETVKYHVGNNTTTDTSPSVSSRTMTAVASMPSVTIASGTRNGLSNALVKLADVTVSANQAGAIKVQAIPLTVTTTAGSGITAILDQALTVENASGTDLTSTYSITMAGGAGTSGNIQIATGGHSDNVTIVFGTPYTIAAGGSATFSIWATPSSVSGATNTTSVSTKLQSGGSTNHQFLWTDVSGNQASIVGSGGNIVAYPVDSSVITN